MPTVVAEPARTVTPSHRDVLAKSFDDLTEALEHAVSLATRGKGYRITVRDDDTAPTDWSLQVVDQDSVFGDGEYGLTLVLIDPTADLPEASGELRRLCDESPFESLPTEQGYGFATRFGTDITAARAVVERPLPEPEGEAGGRFWTVISRARSAIRPCW